MNQSINMMRYLPLFALSTILTALIFTVSCKDDPVPTGEVEMSELLSTNSEISTELNPHGVTPLSAEVSFTAKEPVKAEIEVRGELDVSHSWDNYAQQQSIPVLGLYPGTTNNVYLKLTT
ncbi:MAG TPA: aryl-sulfate sulfotransferase N-terminal domain-containing protein, partial [Bacteroidales bacterium]|nr:aryl-sulfate sulfotransferase N-terminal domain-containing protein [Bacteroidales bacterium]